MALSAIASTAAAAAADFAPYVAAVLPALQHFLTAQAPELLLCRCRATECMGLLLEHLAGTQQAAAELVPQVGGACLPCCSAPGRKDCECMYWEEG